MQYVSFKINPFAPRVATVTDSEYVLIGVEIKFLVFSGFKPLILQEIFQKV